MAFPVPLHLFGQLALSLAPASEHATFVNEQGAEGDGESSPATIPQCPAFERAVIDLGQIPIDGVFSHAAPHGSGEPERLGWSDAELLAKLCELGVSG